MSVYFGWHEFALGYFKEQASGHMQKLATLHLQILSKPKQFGKYENSGRSLNYAVACDKSKICQHHELIKWAHAKASYIAFTNLKQTKTLWKV
jgi:hypothetical protein